MDLLNEWTDWKKKDTKVWGDGFLIGREGIVIIDFR